MGVVSTQWWRFVAEVLPGLVLALAGVLAAFTPYALLRKTGKGRARSAIAYLSGLAVGLALTVVLAALFQPLVRSGRVAEAGLLGAFLGPFAGMLRARWERPRRRAARSRRRSPSRSGPPAVGARPLTGPQPVRFQAQH